MNSQGIAFAELCRLCLKKESELTDLFEMRKLQAENRDVELAYLLNVVTSIEVFEDDGLPNKICNFCKTLLEVSYKFKQYSKKADTSLMIYNCTGTKPDPIEIPEEILSVIDPPPKKQVFSQPTQKKATSSKSVAVAEDEEVETIVETLDEYMDYQNSQNYQIVQDDQNEDDFNYVIIDPNSDNYQIVESDVNSQRFVKDENVSIETVQILNHSARVKQEHQKKRPVKTDAKPKPKILNKGATLQLKDPKIQCSEDGAIQIITEVEAYEKADNIKMEFNQAETVATNVFSCNQCERSFPLEQLLEIHMRNHTRERNHPCSYCDKKFFSKYDLNKHNLTHTGERPYECIVCHKAFSRSTLLTRHEKTHTDVVKIQCVQCDRQFLKEEDYIKHVEKHNKNRPFQCNFCNKRFAFKQGLERHEVVHKTDQPLKCQYCDLSFPSAGILQRHVAKHAGNRPYPCKLCNKSFLLSHHLSRHVRSHQQEQGMTIYKCGDCNKDFEKENDFVEHIAGHAVETSSCPMCKEQLSELNEVEPHIQLHLSNDQHNCDYCDSSFFDESHLEKHCSEKHANEMCSIIPINEKLLSAEDEDDVIQEYIVEELELKAVDSPKEGSSKRQFIKQETGIEIQTSDNSQDQYFVLLETESDEAQPLPAKISKTSDNSDISSIQRALAKVKGLTVTKNSSNV